MCSISTYHKIRVDDPIFTDNNQDQRIRYECPLCNHLLIEAVQISCGHWVCGKNCADTLFSKSFEPMCPRQDCDEKLTEEDGKKYFPDKFVRKEIGRFQVKCKYHGNKCPWTGSLKDMDEHLQSCAYILHPCNHCNTMFSKSELPNHERNCAKAMMSCPFAVHGCEITKQMTRAECDRHLQEEAVNHSRILAKALKILQDGQKEHKDQFTEFNSQKQDYSSVNIAPVRGAGYNPEPLGGSGMRFSQLVQTDSGATAISTSKSPDIVQPLSSSSVLLELENLRKQVTAKDSQIRHLQDKVLQMETTILSKTTENEDRDFRLSLMENSNYDGTMLWKVPQFSQRRDDATTGKYTSIFSLPFYSGRYGYKMCLRLYILGDGIGKGSHMSLFFVLMKGEFDNILQWPFNHKVTFKLINQCGGRDVVDVFQPDPLSSSFQKPKTDMNIASGCPRFISLNELVQNGFIMDDTIFIKVKVDTSTMRHP